MLWLVWQFLLFLYDFKFIRDIIEETKLANQIHPEEDNLKVQLDRQYEKDEIIQESISDGAVSHNHEEDTIEGIQKQYGQVVHYFGEKSTPNKKAQKREANTPERSDNDSQQPRFISSRGSSRMLFADINVEDIE